MKKGKVAVNLSISVPIANAAQAFIAMNRRKGRKNLSELTEALWISYMRRKGAKLPPLFKGSAA